MAKLVWMESPGRAGPRLIATSENGAQYVIYLLGLTARQVEAYKIGHQSIEDARFPPTQREPCPLDGCQWPGICDGRHCKAAGGAIRRDPDIDGPTSALIAALGIGWKPQGWRWGLGQRLRKRSGAWWEGRVVGFYSTEQTPLGYGLQLEQPNGPVQIYPEGALEEM